MQISERARPTAAITAIDRKLRTPKAA